LNVPRIRSTLRAVSAAAVVCLLALSAVPALAAWEPTKPIEFVVPAGTGGGADQMARFIQGVVAKHKLSAQPIIVVNKSGGAGAEGFLDVKGDKGNAHKMVITLSNLFTTPLATGVTFNWRDLTPVQMLALDQFILWVNVEAPYKTSKAASLRPLCVMDKERLPYTTKTTATQAWADVPTCASAGVPVDYLMLRGIFMPPGVSADQVAYYLGLFATLRALPEWKDFMDKGAFKQPNLSGPAFAEWLGKNEDLHRGLMKEAGFIAN
jgi:tripartite-type tricarboxylate transporter receptor subunit TctC